MWGGVPVIPSPIRVSSTSNRIDVMVPIADCSAIRSLIELLPISMIPTGRSDILEGEFTGSDDNDEFAFLAPVFEGLTDIL